MLKRIVVCILGLSFSASCFADEAKKEIGVICGHLQLATMLAQEVGGEPAAELAGKFLLPRFKKVSEALNGRCSPYDMEEKTYEKIKAMVQNATAETKGDHLTSDYIWAPVPMSADAAVAHASVRATMEALVHESTLANEDASAKTFDLKAAVRDLIIGDEDLPQFKRLSLPAQYLYFIGMRNIVEDCDDDVRPDLAEDLHLLRQKPALLELRQMWDDQQASERSFDVGKFIWITREDRIQTEMAQLIGFINFVTHTYDPTFEDAPGKSVWKGISTAMFKLNEGHMGKEFNKLLEPAKLAVRKDIAEGQTLDVAAWKYTLSDAVYPKLRSILTADIGRPMEKLIEVFQISLITFVNDKTFANAHPVEQVFYFLHLQNIANHFDQAGRNEILPVFWAFLDRHPEAAKHFHRIMDEMAPKKIGPVFERVLDAVPSVSSDLAHLMASFLTPTRVDWEKAIPMLRQLLDETTES